MNFLFSKHYVTMSRNVSAENAAKAQARYWLLTIHDTTWSPPENLPEGMQWLRGQREIGEQTNNEHWQLYVAYKKAVRLARIKKDFGRGTHAEPTRSSAAEDYVFKEETSVSGTRFELGTKALNRNSKTDWERQWDLARQGDLENLDADIKIKYYNTLKKIKMDYMKKPKDLGKCSGIWIYGPPGSGKSHFARAQYGDSLYLKAQNKWWDGYQGEKNVLLDDFDYEGLGHHIKIWADKYTFMAECKGSSIQIRPNNFIITSNYTPEQIFKDPVVAEAVRRRMYIIHMPFKYNSQ